MSIKASYVIATAFFLVLCQSTYAAEAERSVSIDCVQDHKLIEDENGRILDCVLASDQTFSINGVHGNGSVTCAKGSYARFYRSGRLSYCDRMKAAGRYVKRDGHEQLCVDGIAFDEAGAMRYCASN